MHINFVDRCQRANHYDRPPAPATMMQSVNTFILKSFMYYYIQLYSPHNMVAQANKTSKNTTNEIEKNDNSSTLHI